ncbi:MAG: hypothetical protein AAF539_08205 [Planctomycetota bacterium]
MDDAQYLATLIAKRDAILPTVGTKADYVEIEHRGRRHRVESSIANLQFLNTEIERVRATLNATKGPARNKARLARA